MAGRAGPGNELLDRSLLDRADAQFRELKRRFDQACDYPSDETSAALRLAVDNMMRSCAAILLALGRGP
jgi:hypothetical protein